MITKLENVQDDAEIAELKSKLYLAEDNSLAEREHGKTLYKVFLNTQAEAKNNVSEKVFQLIFDLPSDGENKGFDPEVIY